MNQNPVQYQDTGQPITALYERLSRDDEQANESLSIVNQKSYLAEYAAGMVSQIVSTTRTMASAAATSSALAGSSSSRTSTRQG